MLLLAVWAYLQTKITDVPTLSYTSTSEILSYTLSLERHRQQNSPYFCIFKYARAVKQKVWNEAQHSTNFFTDFEKKKTTVLQF